MQLYSSELQGLILIADSSTSLAGLRAKNILNFGYGYNYGTIPQLSAPQNKSGVIYVPSHTNQGNDNSERSFAVYPNPATNWIVFKYTLENHINQATITVSDIIGRNIESFVISGDKGQILWDTRNIIPGVYIYCVQVHNKIIARERFIIK